MKRTSKLYKNTAILCTCMTFLLGVVKANASGQEGNMATPASAKPAPLTQQECNMLASAGTSPEISTLQCGEGEELLLILLLIVCLAAAVAAAAPDGRHR